jgi:signal transduction histidine kinase
VRPLDFLPSIKLKLGVVIVAAVLVTVIVVLAGERAGWPLALTGVAAVLVALALVQGLAHGMTRPLREMVGAARAMSKGDYERRVTASSRDEVGELGRAFNRMAGDLAEVDRVRRDLVANVSHELRTPLGALRAMLENLVDGVETADPETLAAMLQHVERLGSLVEQLLDLSKLESGVVPLDRRPVRARELLDRVAGEWGPAARASDVSIELAVEPDSLVLDVDQARVHQVLANLVANAIRHSPAGGRVSVRASTTSRGATFEVADEGRGIAPDERDRVFERFYRSDHAHSSGDGGSGLGLSIARWIVELHDGTIRTEERTPHGCRMVVELPQ